MTEEIKKRIDQVFSRWNRGICPGGQVLIRQKGEIVYDRCFGYADIENRIPITDQTVFHVASVSKQFTVMGAMLLQEEGRLCIDDDVRAYIPEYIGFSEPLSVRDLMNNNTGIRDFLELVDRAGVINKDTITQPYALAMIGRQKKLNFLPRTRHLYSNSNFVLLASVVERVAGMSLRAFLEERIFRPLGMSQTVVRDTYWECIDHRARSFHDNGSSFCFSPLSFGVYGTTSLHTTAHDLMLWMEQYRNPTICSADTIRTMTTAAILEGGAPNTYACGLREDYLEGHRYIKHAGEDAGFRAFTFRLMEDDIDIVTLSNCETVFSDPSTLEVARILLGLPEKAAVSLPVQEDFDPADGPGFYYGLLPDTATVKIVEHKGQLAVAERYGPAPLTHIRGNLYRKGQLDIWYLLGGEKPCLVTAEEEISLAKAPDAYVSEAWASGCAGRYYSREIEALYTVLWKEGRLYIDHLRHGASILHPAGEDRFATEYSRSCFVQFLRNDRGEVTGLAMSGARVLALTFEKMQEGVL